MWLKFWQWEGKSSVSKKKLTVEDFVSFCTGSRYIAHNLMRDGTINFRHFKQDYSPGVRAVVNSCNITLTFPLNGRYNSEPEQFLKNIIDDISCSSCFEKCWFVNFDNTYESVIVLASSSLIFYYLTLYFLFFVWAETLCCQVLFVLQRGTMFYAFPYINKKKSCQYLSLVEIQNIFQV